MELTPALISFAIAVVAATLYFLKRNFSYWKEQGVPHEVPHIIMGNFRGLCSVHQFGEIVAVCYKKFKDSGPFAGIYIMQQPAVVLLDKNLIKTVLMKDFNTFTDRGLYFNEKSDPLTGHLFLLNGSKWKNLRHKLTATFTSSKLRGMYPTLVKRADQLSHVLEEKITTDTVVNIQHMLSRFAIDNVGSCFLGIECNCLGNENSGFPKMAEKFLGQPRHSAFVMALIEGFPKLAHLLGMRIIAEDVHQFFSKTFKEAINYRAEYHIQRNDFLNTLLEQQKNGADQLGLSVEEICAQAFVFFMEGFETSTLLVSYALYELAQHPEIQDRLRQEIQDAFESSEDGVIAYETIKSLEYMDKIMSETLRKYPVMPQINRQALDDYIIPNHPKYVIKKGMRVVIPVLGLHHDPDFYPEPEKFDPERFTPEVAKQRDAMEYLPFGDGPRRCIGERFGQMQSRLGLIYLIKSFRFSTCAQTEIPLSFNSKAQSYVPKNAIHLRLEKIM